MVFVSGQIAINPANNEFLDEEIQTQTRQVIENLKAILEKADSSLDKILKISIFLTDMKDFDNVNQIYSEYFGNSLPARACVEVSRLPRGAKIEMEAIACC